MSLELIAFCILSAGLLGTSLAVLIARNPIHSALFLVLGFFFLAGLYVQLNANFVAIIQVLVYAGAIMVLFLFVIMLLNLSDRELGAARINVHKILGIAAAIGLSGVLIASIVGAQQRYLGDAAHMRSAALERLDERFPLSRLPVEEQLKLYEPLRGFIEQLEANDGAPLAPSDASTREQLQRLAENLGVRGLGDLETARFFIEAITLHTIAHEKLRMELGNESASYEACKRLAVVYPTLNPSATAETAPTLSPEACDVLLPGTKGARRVDACYALADLEAEAPLDCGAALSATSLGNRCKHAQALRTDLEPVCVDAAERDATKRRRACRRLSKAISTMDLTHCNTLRSRLRARVALEVEEAMVAFDARLAALEAAIDASPVPAAWRGAEAERTPSTLPNRYEQAVVDAVGVFFAARLTQTANDTAEQVAPGLTSDTSLTTVWAAQQAAPVESNAQGDYEPGGAFARATRRADLIERKLIALESSSDLLAQLRTQRKALQLSYRDQVRRVLGALRRGNRGQARSLIAGLNSQHRRLLDTPAQRQVDAVLAALRSSARDDLTRRPVIYDEDAFGSVETVGKDLFSIFLLPFEVTSVLLLAGILGAVVIAKRRA